MSLPEPLEAGPSRLSAVIIFLNGEQFIAEAIKSIIAPTSPTGN